MNHLPCGKPPSKAWSPNGATSPSSGLGLPAWALHFFSKQPKETPACLQSRGASIGGVFVDDLVAVAECVCDQSWGQFLDETA
jgi:hypothetical protein